MGLVLVEAKDCKKMKHLIGKTIFGEVFCDGINFKKMTLVDICKDSIFPFKVKELPNNIDNSFRRIYIFEEDLVQKSNYEKVLSVLGLKVGDKINIDTGNHNPYTVLNFQLLDIDGDEANCKFSQIITGELKFTILPKIHTISFDGKEVEISAESYEAIKEQFLIE